MKTLQDYKNINFYVDMDGTIADFYGVKDAVETFKSDGFFKKLKPLKNNLKAVKMLIKSGCNVYVLTASPHPQADGDKIAWCQKYLKDLPLDHIICIRLGENKANYVQTETNNILLDDYNKNCFDFVNKGYRAYCVSDTNTIGRLLKIE